MKKPLTVRKSAMAGPALSTAVFAAGLLGILAPASAQAPDQIYEFTVLSDTLQSPAACDIEPNICLGGVPPTFSEGPAPYRLATLILTHDALTKHVAQYIKGATLYGCNGDEGPCESIDDGRVVSLDIPRSVCSIMSFPPSDNAKQGLGVAGTGYAIDLRFVGNHMSGTIEIGLIEGHMTGSQSLHMTGENGNWSGTWDCAGAIGPLHSFTAIATQVRGHTAQK